MYNAFDITATFSYNNNNKRNAVTWTNSCLPITNQKTDYNFCLSLASMNLLCTHLFYFYCTLSFFYFILFYIIFIAYIFFFYPFLLYVLINFLFLFSHYIFYYFYLYLCRFLIVVMCHRDYSFPKCIIYALYFLCQTV